MTKAALIEVDVQNDFCPGGALGVNEGDEVVVPLNQLKAKIGVTIATRDWHEFEMDPHFKTWPAHCVQGTPGAEFHAALNLDGTTIITKGTDPASDAYSAFDGVVDGTAEPLEQYLRRLGVTRLYVGGLATDYCVKATVLRALELGFVVVLLTDAIRAVNLQPDGGEAAVAEMVAAGAKLATTEEILDQAA